jgi:hypothetical protein
MNAPKLKVGTILIEKSSGWRWPFVISKIDKDGAVYFTNCLGSIGVVHRRDVAFHFDIKECEIARKLLSV